MTDPTPTDDPYTAANGSVQPEPPQQPEPREATTAGEAPRPHVSPARRGWTRRRTGLVAAVAAAMLAAGGVTAAVTADRDPAAAATTTAASFVQSRSASGLEGDTTLPGAAAAPDPTSGNSSESSDSPSSIVHGQVTVSDGSGGTVTQAIQAGTVTAVTSTTITVRSTDGYSATYAVVAGTTLSGTTGTPAAGDTVRVLAQVSGQTATAVTIEDDSTTQGSTGGGRSDSADTTSASAGTATV